MSGQYFFSGDFFPLLILLEWMMTLLRWIRESWITIFIFIFFDLNFDSSELRGGFLKEYSTYALCTFHC
jgi:hypothetical protein